MINNEQQIEILKQRIEVSKLYANYWLTMASTGEAKNRSLFHGAFDGPPFSDEEKIRDAIETAHTHIQNINDYIENMLTLMEQVNKEGI